MLCIVDTEGSKLANLHYLLLLHQATVTFSALKRERHLSPQLCWLECWTKTSSDWTKNKWSSSRLASSKQSSFSPSLSRHKLRREESFVSLLFMRGALHEKDKYCEVSERLRYSGVYWGFILADCYCLCQYFCLISVWSVLSSFMLTFPRAASVEVCWQPRPGQ